MMYWLNWKKKKVKMKKDEDCKLLGLLSWSKSLHGKWRLNYLTNFAKFPAVNGAEYPSKTTWNKFANNQIMGKRNMFMKNSSIVKIGSSGKKRTVTWIMAVFLGSPPDSGENAEPSPLSIVNSTIPLPLSLNRYSSLINCSKKAMHIYCMLIQYDCQ